MRVMIVGASKGLGRALLEGLADEDHEVVGVSRTAPRDYLPHAGTRWIETDLSDPSAASETIGAHAPQALDVVVYNLGIWENTAFTDSYDFLVEPPGSRVRSIEVRPDRHRRCAA